jgi:Flp pilus assembly protein TadD
LSSTSRPEAAEAFLREARARRPKEVTTLAALGDWLDGERRHDEAEAVYREALAIDPDVPWVLNSLGYMNVLRGVRLAEALDLIRRAVEISPLSPHCLDSLGWALFRLGRLSEAEAALRKALARNEGPVLLDHLAQVLSARGELEEALGVWRRAVAGGDADDALRKALEEKIDATAHQLSGRQ